MSVYKKVLTTTDLSNECDHIVKQGYELAKSIQADFHVLHVIPADIAEIQHISDDKQYFAQQQIAVEPNYEEQVKLALAELATRHQINEKNIHIGHGSIKQVVNDYISQHDFDLVVLGSHNRYGLKLLLGSSSDKLIHSLECDILAIRIHQ